MKAPTLRRFAGRCPPRGLIFLGAALRKVVSPTLHRFAGRCPPRGLIFLGAALRKVAAPTLAGLFVAALLWGGFAGTAQANEAVPAVADPVLEARMLAIAAELRCLVCQNQTIADSHAELAVDLRQQVRELLQQGQTDQQVRDYMTARYGDFVLYRPPLNTSTVLLWAGPGLMLVGGLVVLLVVLRRRSRLPDALFDDPAGDEEADTNTKADRSPDQGAALPPTGPH